MYCRECGKLRRNTSNGLKQTFTIFNHGELDKGTLRAIYRQELREVLEDWILLKI